MNINFTTRHVKVPDGTQEVLTEKLERLEKFFEKITSCHVIFDSEHTDKSVEVVMQIMGGTLTATAKADSLGAASESVVAKLERQLKKNNQKVKNHKALKEE
jgi:putative sigma-54 modulation protein